ncbi:Diadenosine tetraphosphate (Ap4A) hydrolase and other HIT family hydrolase [Candidatus Burkholderia humilis]|nr:Diadenosine tetraphosphate (Ap4A) hydrolase and other HIT family hydrolase [Candidatus Burkholderia humilis]
MSQDCIFCKIAAGQIPSAKVYEDDEFLAFNDINPAAPVHVLVIPKRHIETLSHCTENDSPLLGRMVSLVGRLAKDLGVAYTGGDTGFRTVIKTGPGGQEVYTFTLICWLVRVLGGEWAKKTEYFRFTPCNEILGAQNR